MTPGKAVNEISQFQRIIDKFRYRLVLQVIRNKLAKIGIEFSPYYWFHSKFVDLEKPDIKGISSEYTVELLDARDMKMISESARGYSESNFLKRLDAGNLCFGLKHKDNIVAFTWIMTKECTYEPRKFQLNEHEAYLTDTYVMEAYRGRNLAPFLIYKSYEILYKIGRIEIYSVTEFFNTSAMKYKMKLNMRKSELILFICLFKKLKRSYKIRSY
jgi:hypothetical protein